MIVVAKLDITLLALFVSSQDRHASVVLLVLACESSEDNLANCCLRHDLRKSLGSTRSSVGVSFVSVSDTRLLL